MSDEQKSKEPISFEKIGGVKVGHPVPVKGEKGIRFDHVGGRCIRR